MVWNKSGYQNSFTKQQMVIIDKQNKENEERKKESKEHEETLEENSKD
ncbi:hypothetical protein [Paenibacillus alvei]|uniref:Uncharacterized protein n=1 Tax=Paenibacillus alvei TaxID=44250 RepID=A0AAP7A483_PAEAL|nr:hypothetical protein [Paenibacillus alvei]NOJ72467.1 hypothetical protein [Paenibacillus alvei]